MTTYSGDPEDEHVPDDESDGADDLNQDQIGPAEYKERFSADINYYDVTTNQALFDSIKNTSARDIYNSLSSRVDKNRWREEIERGAAEADHLVEKSKRQIANLLLWFFCIVTAVNMLGFVVLSGAAAWHMYKQPGWLDIHKDIAEILKYGWTISLTVFATKFFSLVFKELKD